MKCINVFTFRHGQHNNSKTTYYSAEDQHPVFIYFYYVGLPVHPVVIEDTRAVLLFQNVNILSQEICLVAITLFKKSKKKSKRLIGALYCDCFNKIHSENHCVCISKIRI